MVVIRAPIRAFKVRVLNAQRRVVAEQVFDRGPQQQLMDQPVVHESSGWNRVRVRQNTNTGDFRVSAYENNRRTVFQARIEEPATWLRNDGQRFDVEVEQLSETYWQQGPSLTFEPPRAELRGDANGWTVTFRPQQYPAVLTLAVLNGHKQGTKDESLPSFPFPSSPRFGAGSLFIPRYNNWGAGDGQPVRLGVRGAGLSVTTVLPAADSSKRIAPADFKVHGPADLSLLTEGYVLEKYREKQALITYTAQ